MREGSKSDKNLGRPKTSWRRLTLKCELKRALHHHNVDLVPRVVSLRRQSPKEEERGPWERVWEKWCSVRKSRKEKEEAPARINLEF